MRIGDAGNIPFSRAKGEAGVQRDAADRNYARIRFVDTIKGRFKTPDPIGTEGGYNLLEFVENDPVNGIDPFGLQDETDVGWAMARTPKVPHIVPMQYGSLWEEAVAVSGIGNRDFLVFNLGLGVKFDYLEGENNFSAGIVDSLTIDSSMGYRWLIGAEHSGSPGYVDEDSAGYRSGIGLETLVEFLVLGLEVGLKIAVRRAAIKAGEGWAEKRAVKLATREAVQKGKDLIRSRAMAHAKLVARDMKDAYKSAHPHVRSRSINYEHIEGLFGHHGGKASMFPTGGLPIRINSARRNIAILTGTENAAKHARQFRLERVVGPSLRLLPVRIGVDRFGHQVINRHQI